MGDGGEESSASLARVPDQVLRLERDWRVGVGWKKAGLASPSGCYRTNDQELPGKAKPKLSDRS